MLANRSVSRFLIATFEAASLATVMGCGGNVCRRADEGGTGGVLEAASPNENEEPSGVMRGVERDVVEFVNGDV
jgi:hypothetical protein